jgi:hypothetical protein
MLMLFVYWYIREIWNPVGIYLDNRTRTTEAYIPCSEKQ